MKFVNRKEEMKRLDRVTVRGDAALVVVWGRRRLGKSRLLTEWCGKHGGTYWVADESAAAIQRRYLAAELETAFSGFSAVDYPDWSALLDRLSHEARQSGWRGPLVLDEFPYLIPDCPELPSILQKWVDREKREGGIALVLSGSSQRMMQSTVLNADAPLYGRSDEILNLSPLLPGYIREALGTVDAQSVLDFYTCWGGVPRYWELAQPFGSNHSEAVDDLVLSPLGVLHDEVERLLRQEMPSAIPLRPILDAIGLGAHKSSEIAGRLQTSATSITRSLKQLQELGYIQREVPFGQDEKRSKKSLYKLADPFLRLWFKVVASHRGSLRSASKAGRLKLLKNVWPHLRAQAWEDLCRRAVPRLSTAAHDWLPAGRHWASSSSEWDVVSTSVDGSSLLLAECKSLNREANQNDIDKILRDLMDRPAPHLRGVDRLNKEYLLFVPRMAGPGIAVPPNVHLVDGRQVFEALV